MERAGLLPGPFNLFFGFNNGGNMDDLTRDKILKADDLPLERVEVPEWGGVVYMRVLTGKQRDEIEQLATDRKAAKRFECKELIARLVAMSLCDKKGKLLFGGHDDAIKLNEKSSAVITRLFRIVQRISKISDNDLKEMSSDFEGGPNASFGSD